MLRLHSRAPSLSPSVCMLSCCNSLTISANVGRLPGSAAMHLQVTALL